MCARRPRTDLELDSVPLVGPKTIYEGAMLVRSRGVCCRWGVQRCEAAEAVMFACAAVVQDIGHGE